MNAENAAFETACSEALKQIQDKKYEEVFVRDGMQFTSMGLHVTRNDVVEGNCAYFFGL
ncbi:MAG: hypothetical protein K2I96_06375 [Lachnospiraceae bacterium]|nr:hypothetical protein [Lachnospiraceae bacterium]